MIHKSPPIAVTTTKPHHSPLCRGLLPLGNPKAPKTTRGEAHVGIWYGFRPRGARVEA